MRTTKKSKDKVAIAITLCFCALAIASIFTMRSSLDILNEKPDNNINIAKEGDNQEKNVINPVPVVDSSKEKSKMNETKQLKEEPNAVIYSMPVEGKITVDYSTDFPVYSKTLEQYIIHEGIDFEAPVDADVIAIADGTVTAVYTDDKLGMTIEILHADGLTSKYSNLSTTKLVQVGDEVKAGMAISKVGTSALFESLDPAHLHFEILKEGNQINPNIF